MGLIKAYRDDADRMRQETFLKKHFDDLKMASQPKMTLTFLAHTLTNKLSHNATAAMNKAAYNGDLELLASACNRLLNLKKKQP